MRWPLVAVPASLVLLAQAPPSGSPQPRSVDQLRAFFAENCVRCHGTDGSAHDASGKNLKGKDLTDPKEMKGESDADLEKTIRKGIFFGRAMPAFGKVLSDADIQLMVREVVRKVEKGKPIAPAEAAK
jgi:mono/diheme cytochrome c family protein